MTNDYIKDLILESCIGNKDVVIVKETQKELELIQEKIYDNICELGLKNAFSLRKRPMVIKSDSSCFYFFSVEGKGLERMRGFNSKNLVKYLHIDVKDYDKYNLVFMILTRNLEDDYTLIRNNELEKL